MKKLRSALGYTAAALTIAGAVLIPFLLMNLFSAGVAATGVRVDPAYTGGEPLRTIDKGAYRIIVNRPVERPTPLARIGSFVQIAWTPVGGLPAHVSDEIDLDGDGRPDLRASFNVPKDPGTELRADVVSLNPRVESAAGIGRLSFSRLIARVGDGIVLRVPLR
jgi:hypothetical protein